MDQWTKSNFMEDEIAAIEEIEAKQHIIQRTKLG